MCLNQLSNATGEYPLLRRKLPEVVSALDEIALLLCHKEISFELQESVTFSKCVTSYSHRPLLILTFGWFSSTLDIYETLTLLYYAGYLTMTKTVCRFPAMIISVLISIKPEGVQFKIPNREVMDDWAQWITTTIGGDLGNNKNIVDECVKGPVNAFKQRWPDFMQHQLDPKTVATARLGGANSPKTPERIYQVFLLGLIHDLRSKGWEVTIEARVGEGYVDIRLVSKTAKSLSAVLIELKSSEKLEHVQKDAKTALKQIEEKKYRNIEGLQSVRVLREYGIACYHLKSCVEGRYMELDPQRQWVEKADPGTPSSR